MISLSVVSAAGSACVEAKMKILPEALSLRRHISRQNTSRWRGAGSLLDPVGGVKHGSGYFDEENHDDLNMTTEGTEYTEERSALTTF